MGLDYHVWSERTASRSVSVRDPDPTSTSQTGRYRETRGGPTEVGSMPTSRPGPPGRGSKVREEVPVSVPVRGGGIRGGPDSGVQGGPDRPSMAARSPHRIPVLQAVSIYTLPFKIESAKVNLVQEVIVTNTYSP